MSLSDPNDPDSDPDGDRSDDDSETTSDDETAQSWSGENWLLICLFFGLTVIGVALSVGWVDPGIVEKPEVDHSNTVKVPLFVYLYATLGALGYIFTRLITRLEDFVTWGNIEQLVEMGLRIPAAWILAAGVYLFLPLFNTTNVSVETPWLAAGMAFLVGLYVNVAFKAMGGLAERLLAKGPVPDGDRESDTNNS